MPAFRWVPIGRHDDKALQCYKNVRFRRGIVSQCYGRTVPFLLYFMHKRKGGQRNVNVRSDRAEKSIYDTFWR